jgi:oligosaccharide repeat unit polymerase
MVFAAITYVANVVKFHSVLYFARNLDSFFAGVSLEGGLWFVQTLSWILIFPLVAFVGKNLDLKLWRSMGILACAMVIFTVVAKPSTRTETIALLVAAVIYLFSVRRIRFNALAVGILASCVILMLVFLDVVRQGEASADPMDANASSVVLSAYQNVGPADNGMILIDYLSAHPWLYFKYLAPSLLPTSLIPRALVPFKPRTDIEGVLTYSIFGFDLDPLRYHEGGTLTYTVPAAGYADLGFVGVGVAALIYSFMFCVFLRGWRLRSRSGRFTSLYFLILLIAGLRLSDEALLDTFYWTLLAIWLLHMVAHFHFLAPVHASAKKTLSAKNLSPRFQGASPESNAGAGR